MVSEVTKLIDCVVADINQPIPFYRSNCPGLLGATWDRKCESLEDDRQYTIIVKHEDREPFTLQIRIPHKGDDEGMKLDEHIECMSHLVSDELTAAFNNHPQKVFIVRYRWPIAE